MNDFDVFYSRQRSGIVGSPRIEVLRRGYKANAGLNLDLQRMASTAG